MGATVNSNTEVTWWVRGRYAHTLCPSQKDAEEFSRDVNQGAIIKKTTVTTIIEEVVS